MNSLERVKRLAKQMQEQNSEDALKNSMDTVKALANEYSTNGSLNLPEPDAMQTTVAQTSKEKNSDEKDWWEEIFQSSGVFDDGYNFGDVTKTILGTTADVGLNLLEGALTLNDSLAKLGATIYAQGADWLGQDEKAELIRNRIAGKEEKAFKTDKDYVQELEEKVDKASISGDTLDDVANLVGYTAAMALGTEALGAAGSIGVNIGNTTFNIPTLALAGGGASGAEEAYSKDDVSDLEAWAKILGNAGIEGFTESLFSAVGIGGSSIGDAAEKTAVKQFSSALGKTLARIGVEASGEAAEEFISYASNQGLDFLIDKVSGKDNFYEDWDWSDVGEQMALAFISTVVSEGGNTIVNTSLQTNNAINTIESELGRELTSEEKASVKEQVSKAYANENSVNEQRLVDTMVKDKVAQAEAQGTTLTNRQINTLTNQIQEQLDNGTISTSDIEKYLSDVTSNYASMQSEINELTKQIEETEDEAKKAEFQEKIDTLSNNLKEQLQQDSKIQNAYYENSQRYVNYQANIEDNASDQRRQVYESANRVMNNTTRSRNFVESVANIAEETGTTYEFTNTEELNNNGYQVDGATINGLVTDDGKILINVDSKKVFDAVVGHELTHTFEDDNEYKDISEFAIQYAEMKGEYDSRVKKAENLYKNTNADVNKEVVSDLLGDYITDEKFINNLASQKPTLFQKMYNFVRHIATKATKGSKEARKLENLRYKFQKAYLKQVANNKKSKTTAKNTAKNSEKSAKYSVSKDVENSENNEYNNTEVFINDKQEYAKAMEAIHNKMSQNLNYRGYDVAVTSNYFYVFKNNGFDNKPIIKLQIPIKGNEKLIKKLKEAVKNGNYDNSTSIDSIIKEIYQRRGVNTRSNVNAENGETTRKNDRLYNKKQRENKQESNNRTSNENIKGELENSSLSLKEKQLEIIKNSNPVNDEYHTWIRSVKDIKTFEEALQDDNYEGKEKITPDYTVNMAEKALKTGKITVYSSYPIEQGVFVTPSQMEAKNYVGNGEVYSKEVNLTDVAWIDSLEGQYANVNLESNEDIAPIKNVQYSLSYDNEVSSEDNLGRKLTKKQQDFFKDSAARDENGNLVTVYHTMTDEGAQFNEFNPLGTENYRFGNQVVNYYTDSQKMSGSYANDAYEKADTKKLTTLKQANKWLKSQNFWNFTTPITMQLETTNDKVALVEYENGSRIGTHYYDNLNDALKNVKADAKLLGKSNISNKYQYEGFVNITNPYVVDAEGRNWDVVEVKEDEFVNNAISKTTQEEKNKLIDLANESAEISINYRNKFGKYEKTIETIGGENSIFGLYDASLDKDIAIMSSIVQRIGIDKTNSIIDGNDKGLGVNVYYNIANLLEDTFDKKTTDYIVDEFKIPDNVKSWLNNQYNRQIPPSIDDDNITKDMTLKILYQQYQEAYDNYDKYRMSYSYFIEQISKEGADYIPASLEEAFKAKSEFAGNDAAAEILYDIAQSEFNKEYLSRMLKNNLTTNDIVNRVLEMNNNGYDYDGVIIKNVIDYGGKGEGTEPANLYITFNSNQFKAYDNTSPTRDNDMRYSLSNESNTTQEKDPNRIYGEDVKLQIQEAIEPLQQEIANLKSQISNNVEPASLELAEQAMAERLDNTSDENIPLETGEEVVPDFVENVDINADTKKNILKELRTKFKITDNEAREIYDEIAGLSVNGKYDEVKDAIYNLLKDNAELEYSIENEDIKNAKKYIRQTPIDVSKLKNQISDYNQFRKNNFGRLKLTNNGQSVDSFYQELLDLYPEYFSDSVINPIDQLNAIADFVSQSTNTNYSEYIPEEELQSLTNDLYNRIGNTERRNYALRQEFASLKNNNLEAPLEEGEPTIITDEYGDISINYEPFMQAVEEHTKASKKTSEEETPKVEKSKVRNLKDTALSLWINSNVEIDNLAKESGNKKIKFAGDMLNGVYGEIEGNINIAQTDRNGNIVGEALSKVWNDVKSKGFEFYEAFDDYLKHWSNIDRHQQGKGSIVPFETSEKMIKMYEKKYPEFRKLAENVWKANRNMLEDMAGAGIITNDLATMLKGMYPHYITFKEDKDITPYMPDNGEIKPKRTIKIAKGGENFGDLMTAEEAQMEYLYSYKLSLRQNELNKEIVTTLGHTTQIGADIRTEPTQLNDALYVDEKGNKWLTAYINGEQQSVKISDDLYKGLKNDLEKSIKEFEEKMSLITKPVQALSQIRRNLLTSWNPIFVIKNFTKDAQDMLFNSKHTMAAIKNYPSAVKELMTDSTDLVKTFKSLYGAGNSMGEYEAGYNGKVKKSNIATKTIEKVSNFNNVIELAPRYAEFKASIQSGESIEEAMYNAREVTTNFTRGGTIAKAMNRNGFTFLNASIQGFDKFIRNFSGENGARGVANSVLKATLLGVVPALFNHLMYSGDDEDEDYAALPDYIKDNYYLFKLNDGSFLRIPKGRTLSVFGSAARRVVEAIQGEEDAFEGYLSNAWDQIGMNNPLDNNILTPIIQAINNEAWYGGDIVPSRLQDLPNEEQYDASTDKLSIWLGQKTGLSPYKINYVLEQYGGGIGDILLPMITEEATNNGELLAPLTDEFVVDSITDNKYVSDIYDLSDELTKLANSSEATDEDKLRNSYISSITSEMSELYKERREIQADTSLSKAEKYEKAQAIKDEINKLAKSGLDGYTEIERDTDYAIIGGKEYYKYYDDEGEYSWRSLKDEELDDINSLGMTVSEKNEYVLSKRAISEIKEDAEENDEESYVTKQKIAENILSTNLTSDQKYYLYDKYYGNTETLNAVSILGISADDYITYDSQYFTSEKYADGTTVTNSKKAKVFNYINSMNITFEQRLVLAKLKYTSYDDYNIEIINYLNESDLSYEEEVALLEKMGFDVTDYGQVSWK